ncbi:MAG: hypothetical protein BGO42_02965 [Flavobacterium sp. 40-81]|nr:MAG: hypothetical protein ABS44_22850 [Chryseobacterium sp. SCN 40-13]OJV68808.1 MAG: hypothetical protein BGO42_02965 [Flavobacterium sp. 40-81]
MSAFSQVAHQRPDLSVCNSGVFDLTVQTPVILGGQSGIFPDWKKGFILFYWYHNRKCGYCSEINH